MTRYADITAPSDETLIRVEFEKATGQIISGPLLAWYLAAVRNPDRNAAEGSWHAVLLDIHENQRYNFRPAAGAPALERPPVPGNAPPEAVHKQRSHKE